MNKEFEIKDDKVIVKSERGYKTKREIVDNIEEILTVENNIETIEILIHNENNNLLNSKDEIKSSKSDIILGSIWLVNLLLNILTGRWFVAICNLLCSLCWFSKALCTIIPNRKKIKASQKYISVLQEQLSEQKNNLKELNEKSISINDAMYIDTSKKFISTSEEIINLKNKLTIIYDYQYNKRKYINYFKKGILNKELYYKYSLNNIKLIEELIKNDLDNKGLFINNEKIKQKVITK